MNHRQLRDLGDDYDQEEDRISSSYFNNNLTASVDIIQDSLHQEASKPASGKYPSSSNFQSSSFQEASRKYNLKNPHIEQKQRDGQRVQSPKVIEALERLRQYTPSKQIAQSFDAGCKFEIKRQNQQLKQEIGELQNSEEMLKERIKLYHFQSLHCSNQLQQQEHIIKEITKFFSFLWKVQKKIKKFLGLSVKKQSFKSSGDFINDATQHKFQFKILLDRLSQQQPKVDFATNKAPEMIEDLKNYQIISNELQTQIKSLEEELAKSRQCLGQTTRQLKMREEDHQKQCGAFELAINNLKSGNELLKREAEIAQAETKKIQLEAQFQSQQLKQLGGVQSELECQKQLTYQMRQEYIYRLSELEKQLERSKQEAKQLAQAPTDELILLRLENQRKDDLIESQGAKFCGVLKKLQAKIGVCFDSRLQMTLVRCQQILKEAAGIIDGEISKIETNWSKQGKPEQFLTMANVKQSFAPQLNPTPAPFHTSTPYSPSDAASSPSSPLLIPSRSSIIFHLGKQNRPYAHFGGSRIDVRDYQGEKDMSLPSDMSVPSDDIFITEGSNSPDTKIGSDSPHNFFKLVKFSVRAQDYIERTHQISAMSNTFGDSQFMSVLIGSTEDTGEESLQRSSVLGEAFQLPNIKAGQMSPFKGFLDLSIVSQKIRKSLKSQQTYAQRKQSHDAGTVQSMDDGGNEYQQRVSVTRGTAGTRFKPQDNQVQMGAKVLETWINDTLTDAEHLDIPGLILKPEHKNPISRYGIDRISFQLLGIPNDLADRVYRALFVYSVGFYELIRKVLQHCDKKYTIITNIWKVFAILLEYCCRTDYRMLISEINKEHKLALEQLEREFQTKFDEQATNEKLLKENTKTVEKYLKDTQQELNEERVLRVRIEEEFNKNTQNHEEEVQLRLKFESKLNNMHSAHRDLESKYKRVLNDLTNNTKTVQEVTKLLNIKNQEASEQKQKTADQETKIRQQQEEIVSLKRDLNLKKSQMDIMDQQSQRLAAELDQFRFKVQDSFKLNTELKLKVDLLESTIDGLKSYNNHSQLELTETKELLAIFQNQNASLVQEMTDLKQSLNSNKREMINYTQTLGEKNEKMNYYKGDMEKYKKLSEEQQIQLGTLSINVEKTQAALDLYKRDYEDSTAKLLLMNKSRHDLEDKLMVQIENGRELERTIRQKNEELQQQFAVYGALDLKAIGFERNIEALIIQKDGLERSMLVAQTVARDRAALIEANVVSMREERDLWISRFDSENQEHLNTTNLLGEARTELKDCQLILKAEQIKLNTLQRQSQLIQEQKTKFQLQLNDALSHGENTARELSTQQEIMKQLETTRLTTIQKLKKDLDEIEATHKQILNEKQMELEDVWSQAMLNMERETEHSRTIQTQSTMISDQNLQLQQMQAKMGLKNEELEGELMRNEDYCFSLIDLNIRFQSLTDRFYQKEIELDKLQHELRESLEREDQAGKQLQALKVIMSIEKVCGQTMTDLTMRDIQIMEDKVLHWEDLYQTQADLVEVFGQRIADLEAKLLESENQAHMLKESAEKSKSRQKNKISVINSKESGDPSERGSRMLSSQRSQTSAVQSNLNESLSQKSLFEDLAKRPSESSEAFKSRTSEQQVRRQDYLLNKENNPETKKIKARVHRGQDDESVPNKGQDSDLQTKRRQSHVEGQGPDSVHSPQSSVLQSASRHQQSIPQKRMGETMIRVTKKPSSNTALETSQKQILLSSNTPAAHTQQIKGNTHIRKLITAAATREDY